MGSKTKAVVAALSPAARRTKMTVYKDESGQWRWRLVRYGRNVAASGEAFASKPNAVRAAEAVLKAAGDAGGVTVAE